MPKILVYSHLKSDEKDIAEQLKEVGYIVKFVKNSEDIAEETADFIPDVAILSSDGNVDEVSKMCRKVRLIDQNGDIQILLVIEKNSKLQNISQAADGYISRPVDNGLLLSTVNSHLKIKNHLGIFSENNNELAQRFYQLKVLYDTNSSLAGTLSPKKLIKIMTDGLEQSISFSICVILLVNNQNDITLFIDSMYPLTKKLEQAIKLRTLTSYKALFQDGNIPLEFNINDIKTKINYKNDDEEYDMDIIKYKSIFSPISTQDKFFGTVEIFREDDLSNEDTTCFQTIVSQVAIPLESAILYEEIQEKNEKLIKLEKLKSEFISIVSHELRTPLQPINNVLDIILSGKAGDVTDKMVNFLNMGKRNVKSLKSKIDNLLDLSKIEAGKMEYRFEKINMVEIINTVVATFTPTAMEKNITLEAVLKANEADIYADAQKIEEVLTNLVSNALKFTNEKGKVKVILSEDKKHPDLWRVEVKDTGIGISEENLNKVFDKFQQIENSLSRRVGGTGLGLPIAKGHIVAHRGNIWVESEIGKGSTFAFTIPKYSEYSNFLAELSLFYEKSKNANTNFGILKVKTNDTKHVLDFVEKEGKIRKTFAEDNMIYIITQNLNKNLYELYLEKLQDFAEKAKNDNMLLCSVYCDFSEEKQLKDIIFEFESR